MLIKLTKNPKYHSGPREPYLVPLPRLDSEFHCTSLLRR